MRPLALKLCCTTLLLLLVTAAFNVGNSKAVPQITYGYTCVSYVPASWGQYKGGNQQSGLAFEDNTGTLRFVTNLPCDSTPQPALEIRRTAPASNN